ncbi:MAG: flagellar assembly protein FliW [Ignavibacteriota bacterium]
MPHIRTAYFGELDYENGTVFHFPFGLPGFEQENAFLFLKQPHTEPLLFLQSLVNPRLCFILLPILAVAPNYAMHVDAEDLAALNLNSARQPRIGQDILCAAIVTPGGGPDGAPTANLMAPVVVNLKEQTGMQVIQAGSPYSHRHPIAVGKEVAPCS